MTVFWYRFLLIHQECILFPEQQIYAIFYTHSLAPGRWPTTQFSFDTPPGEPQVTIEGLRPTGLPLCGRQHTGPAGCKWISSSNPCPRSGWITCWNDSQTSGKLSVSDFSFIIKATTQEQPSGRDAESRSLGEEASKGPDLPCPLQAHCLLSTLIYSPI